MPRYYTKNRHEPVEAIHVQRDYLDSETRPEWLIEALQKKDTEPWAVRLFGRSDPENAGFYVDAVKGKWHFPADSWIVRMSDGTLSLLTEGAFRNLVREPEPLAIDLEHMVFMSPNGPVDAKKLRWLLENSEPHTRVHKALLRCLTWLEEDAGICGTPASNRLAELLNIWNLK